MKYYKVHISSAQGVGTWSNGYYHVDLPINDMESDWDWQVCIESMSFNNTFNYPFIVVSPSIPLVSTVFSTTTNTTLNVLLLNSTNNYQTFVTFDTIGNRIASPVSFRNATVNIQILDAVTGVAFVGAPLGASVTWSMIMVVYAVKKNPRML